VSDDLITMKSKSAGEEVSVPYGMAVWSAGIGTRPVIMDFMQQIGQVVESLITS
jgi:NADH:ubiquinone reductase (non-electrogenic)